MVITRQAGSSRRRVSSDRSGSESSGSAPGSAGTVLSGGSARACCASWASSVPATTPTSIAGTRRFSGAHRRTMTMVTSAEAIGSGCQRAIAPRTPSHCWATELPPGSDTPVSTGSCALTISTAAPPVKPTITEWGTRSISRPARIRPSSTCSTPTRNDRVITSRM